MSLGQVLVVDDDPKLLKLVETGLSNAGYSVRTAGSGKEALKSVEKGAPDLIIMDLVMPEMDGAEAAKTLLERADFVDTRILFLTGTITGTEEDEKGINIGGVFCACIAKPFKMEQLLQAVARYFP